MPKVTPKRTTRKHEQSAKKSSKAQAEADPTSAASTSTATTSTIGTSAANDPSRWRASKLRDSHTITKSDARKQYRLSEDDLKGIPFRTDQTFARGAERSMFIYKEGDIERRAWEKYGGPDGFDQYLAKLKVSYLKRYGPDAEFPQPRTYADPYPKISIARLAPGTSQSSGPIDLYVRGSPKLLNIKNQMVPWLWNAYNDALSLIDDMDEWLDGGVGSIGSHGLFTRTKDREGPMKDALVMMPTYPTRPAEPLPSSASVDKVRAVLADAPKLPGRDNWESGKLPGLAIIEGRDDNGESTFEYRWSDDYLERLFTVLIDVVTKHGTGPEGFEGIRWGVYDKCVKFLMADPRYHPGKKMWTDDPAAEWLDGQFASLEDTYLEKCPAGKRFNEMLPRRNPQGKRSVGVRPGYYARRR